MPPAVAVNLPDLVAIATATLAIIGATFGVWWRTAYQVASARADELDKSLRDAHDRLEQALRELGNAKKVIERYEALPNLERVVTMMAESAERQDTRAERRTDTAVTHIVEMLERHEERAGDRHVKTLAALGEITLRLEKLNGGR